eukprot:6208707-Pleurochrysis_carterae.AAC.2
MSRSSGQDMADASTPSDPDPDWLGQWKVTFEDSCRMMRDLKAADREGRIGLSPRLRQRLERFGGAGHRKRPYLLVRKRTMSPLPVSLAILRPNGRRTERARTFWYGPRRLRA